MLKVRYVRLGKPTCQVLECEWPVALPNLANNADIQKCERCLSGDLKAKKQLSDIVGRAQSRRASAMGVVAVPWLRYVDEPWWSCRVS